ncbi:Cell division protein FtsK [Patulibacter medicamentivorans]|uniref:Cell division protein FtsK n=1 Tax=Patulibacter medicamentivorans TaxID=1097667 RepID=H0E2U9_9ACTN|nr:DNA translocase FtsK [Patulibacter medicamentivorans]EHN12027.1 Cell division protein FtsK [Patulibacter medicamentivorans]
MSRTRTPARTASKAAKPKKRAAAGGRSKAAARPRAGKGGSLPAWRSLEQRQFDQIGLGLLALSVFLVFLMYLGSWGGAIGDGLVGGLRSVFGQVAYLAPPAVAATGLLLILRPLLPALRPFRSGAVLLLLALMLLFASGTFGLGGGARHGSELWSAEIVRPRGGVIGDALYWGISSLLGSIGAHVIGVTALLAGVLLLTGASIASMVSRTGEGLRQTTTALRRVPSGMTGESRAVGRRDADDEELEIPVTPRRRAAPPEPRTGEGPVPPRPKRVAEADLAPEDESAPRVRRRRGAAEPATGEEITASRGGGRTELDGARRYPDLFGEEGETRLDLPVAEPVDEAPEPVEEPEHEEDFTVVVPPPVEPPTRVARVRPAADEPATADGERPTLQELRERQPMGGDHDAPEDGYVLPDPGLLKVSAADQLRPDTAGQAETADALVEALAHFKVDAKVINTVAGPHITRYELRLAPGIKMSKVAQLKDDLAYALAATDIRILAPVPGKTAVGVEVPNKRRRIVHLGDVYGDPPGDASPLTVWLGKDVSGAPVYADLAKMPHMLVAGTTGAGKSGCVNAMLSSILLHATPDDVRLVLVDPKQVELNHYEAVPHLLTPVITSPKMAANALQNLVREMEWRYGVMSVKKTRNLIELNKVRVEEGDEPLPYILCVIDELADLMMVAPADVEDAIIRIAQKARAVGIHLVLATQSPRVDVITGMIKANVPSRIAFSVSSQTDSRVILDQNGAESLLGRGDMLFNPVGSSRLTRIQGAYIDEAEIAELTAHWAQQGEAEMREDLLEAAEDVDATDGGEDDLDADTDPLLADAIELVVEMGAASTSGLQRRLRVGYTRAGRLVDMMERRGIVSGFEGSKARQVLVSPMDLPKILAQLRGGGGDAVASDGGGDLDGPHPPPTGEDTADDRTGEHTALTPGR